MKNTIFFALSLFVSFAQAGTYDDRARIAQQRETRAQIAQMKANAESARKKDLIDIENFGKKNSGYAKKPDCQNSWGSRGRASKKQVCGKNLCVNFTTDRSSLKSNASYYEADFYYRAQNISSCEVLLKNGWACVISINYNDGRYDTFGGNCLDSRGNSKVLSVPSVWAR